MPSSRLTFPLVQRRRIVGLSFGGMRSVRRGRGSDVAGSRPYVPGDDVAAIDWAASAKLSLARGVDEFIVRERFADEAPRLVVVCDRRPAMALFPPPYPWLRKPEAVATAIKLISDSGLAARAFIGYLDHADGDAFWRPPRSQKELDEHDGRPFGASDDTLARSLRHLVEHRRDLPPGTFVFVLSDFLVMPDDDTWMRAVERRWDLVPVVVQDPTWEQSFPTIDGIVVPFVDPRTGRAAYAELSAAEVAERRAANEERLRRIVATLQRLHADPVLLSSGNPGEAIDAFLGWADRRFSTRGGVR